MRFSATYNLFIKNYITRQKLTLAYFIIGHKERLPRRERLAMTDSGGRHGQIRNTRRNNNFRELHNDFYV